MIQSVETLLDNDGILQIAGAIYIHAVEEHGKYLYVNNLPVSAGAVVVQREKFRGHNFKIDLAKNDLPADCFTLKQGAFQSSSFSRSSFDVHEVADWQTRLTILNTDLENGRTPALPEVTKTDLTKAVTQFKSHLHL